ncbi:MAG: four helix bundle protein [Patescibacteria group bacterium]|nr:four helix bundle protein [Patescibacteria group bacterium]
MSIPDEFLEKFRKPDGSIDFGKAATSWLEEELKEEKKKKEALEELSLYKLANELSDKIWEIVSKWDYFNKKTIGEQWVRATDSIAANITEGYGRYFFGEYIMFLYYARGSLYESMFWLEKAHKRLLISDCLFKELKKKFDKLPIEINKVVKVVKTQANKWKGRPKW